MSCFQDPVAFFWGMACVWRMPPSNPGLPRGASWAFLESFDTEDWASLGLRKLKWISPGTWREGCGPAALVVALEHTAAGAWPQASVGGASVLSASRGPEAAGREGLCEPPQQGYREGPGAWQEEAGSRPTGAHRQRRGHGTPRRVHS